MESRPDEKLLEYMLELEQLGVDHSIMARGLGACDLPDAWTVRNELLEFGLGNQVALGLAGLESEQAVDMRKRLEAAGCNISYIAAGLAGLDTESAWSLRLKYLAQGARPDFVAEGLAGLDSEKAHELRETLMRSGADRDWLARSLSGCDSPRAWELRRTLRQTGADLSMILYGLAGCDSEEAWSLRDEALGTDSPDLVEPVGRSLGGIDSTRADSLRREICEFGGDVKVLRGLAGVYSEESWRIRNKVKERADERELGALALSLFGDELIAALPRR